MKCGHGTCGANALKGSDPPRCFRHSQDPGVIEKRNRINSEAGKRSVQSKKQKKQQKQQTFADEDEKWLASLAEEPECKQAESRVDDWKQMFIDRGWSLVHRIVNGGRERCSLPTCWCCFHPDPERCLGDCWKHHGQPR